MKPNLVIVTSGVALINYERYQQIFKHQWSDEHDDAHKNGELANYAAFMLTGDNHYFPEDWDEKWCWPVYDKKSYVERLITAGALIAAELDRIEREQHKKIHDGEQQR